MKHSRVFLFFCVAVVGLYALAGYRGWALSKPPAAIKAPPDLRSSGYRSYSYWRGGK